MRLDEFPAVPILVGIRYDGADVIHQMVKLFRLFHRLAFFKKPRKMRHHIHGSFWRKKQSQESEFQN